MLQIKGGVNISGVRPEVAIAIQVAAGVYESVGYDCVITSVLDGKHSRGSLHYVGQAFDIRVNNMPGGVRTKVFNLLRKALGAQFDVIYGDINHLNHIHVEFQPKK